MGKVKKYIFPAIVGVLLLGIYLALNVAPPNAPWISKEREEYGGTAVIRIIQENSPSVQEQIDLLKNLGFAANQVDDDFFLEQLIIGMKKL